MTLEFNWFGESPKRHIKITAETFEELANLYLQFEAFKADCLDQSRIDPEDLPWEEPPASVYSDGPTARQEARQPSQVPSPVSVVARPAVRPTAGAVKCGLCGRDVYDEHKSKFWNNGLGKSGRPKPGWRCKDKECDAIAWDEYDENNQWTGIGEWRTPKL